MLANVFVEILHVVFNAMCKMMRTIRKCVVARRIARNVLIVTIRNRTVGCRVVRNVVAIRICISTMHATYVIPRWLMRALNEI